MSKYSALNWLSAHPYGPGLAPIGTRSIAVSDEDTCSTISRSLLCSYFYWSALPFDTRLESFTIIPVWSLLSIALTWPWDVDFWLEVQILWEFDRLLQFVCFFCSSCNGVSRDIPTDTASDLGPAAAEAPSAIEETGAINYTPHLTPMLLPGLRIGVRNRT
jgi:hypothetical protein